MSGRWLTAPAEPAAGLRLRLWPWVRVLGIDSADDYLRLAGYLEGVSIVKRVTPVSASADVLELDLELATGIANFAKYADRGEVLSTVSAGERSDDADGDAVAPQVATFRLD